MSRVPATARPTAILILSFILAACSETPAASSAEETAAPTPSPEVSESAAPSESAEASGEAAVVTADSDLGAILTDAAGMTIYFFANDTEGTSNCEGDCLANWPPVEAEDSPAAGEGVTAELGTIERSDGTRQLTVNGFPAYYFAADAAAGDVNGQGVGGVWWVFGADGEHIES
jgi:predicted lipoprotein with Yx(FWY)xxD motif